MNTSAPTPAQTEASAARAPRPPRVLSIAGTDPTGGAGIQADLKSIAANGGYGMAVVTALVAQNTLGVRSVHVPPVRFLREQLDAVSDDVEIDAVKIGMLGTVEIITTVAEWLARTRPPIVVLDPVMIAQSGDRLLDADAEHALRELVSVADVVTPNLPELAVLADEPPAEDWNAAIEQARRVSAATGTIVLAKGGHLDDGEAPDALVDASGTLPNGRSVVELVAERVDTANTHGTGCSLSSALATLGARHSSPEGTDWELALRTAKHWLTGALRAADALEVGQGDGPIDHFHALRPDDDPARASFSTALWDEIAPLRDRIDELAFVRGLGDGTLDRAAFTDYLAQDSRYLREYSRALARASQLAPSETEQAFWAASAHEAIEVEMELHRSWLTEDAGFTEADRTTIEASGVTSAYTNHLLAVAAAGDYPTLVAALLPCFWLYQDIGERLHARSHPGHPFAAWLDTYADPGFAETTRRAIELTDQAAADATPAQLAAMRRAFITSSEHELAFFDDHLG